MNLISLISIDSVRHLRIGDIAVRFPTRLQIYPRQATGDYEFHYTGVYDVYRKFVTKRTMYQGYLEFVKSILDEESLFDHSVSTSRLADRELFGKTLLPSFVRTQKRKGLDYLVFRKPIVGSKIVVALEYEYSEQNLTETKAYLKMLEVSNKYCNEVKDTFVSYEDIFKSVKPVTDNAILIKNLEIGNKTDV